MWKALFITLALLLPASAYAQLATVGAGGSGNSSPAPITVDWSTLGIVADGVTDNTAAINAMCSYHGSNYCTGTTTIQCDTGASNTVLVSGQWFRQSNLHLELGTGADRCTILLTWDNVNQNFAVITQSDLSVPLSGDIIHGGVLDFQSNTHNTRTWINWDINFSWTDTQFKNYNQIGLLRLSNAEIGNLVGTGCQQSTGKPGLRIIKTAPNVPSTGKPTVRGIVANVWIHDNNLCSGDGTYQISPGQTTALWGDTPNDSDGVVFQNNVCATTSGPCILIGDGGAAGTYSGTIKNWVVDGISGTCGNTCVTVSASADGGITTTLGQVRGCDLDDAADPNASASLFIRQPNVSFITVDSCNIVNSNNFTVRLDSNPTDITISNSIFGAARACVTANFFVRDATRVTITGNTILASAGCDALLLAPTGHFVQTATINTNTLTGVPDGQDGLHLVNIDSATGTGNVITPAVGTTTSKGIAFTAAAGADPGTTNSQINGNDPSAVTGTKVAFTCNGGTTNQAISNTGAPDHNCP